MVVELFNVVLWIGFSIGIACLAVIGVLLTIGVCKEIIKEYDLGDIFNKSKE